VDRKEHVVISAIINRMRSISLKWKLLIPFLLFAFTGSTTLALIGLTSQQRLIRQEEHKELIHYYDRFLEALDEKKEQALSLAIMMAANREVQRLLADRDRAGLKALLHSTFLRLNRDFDIAQVHFHVPPAVSFLRLHSPEKSGDEMESYRGTIRDAVRMGTAITGLEKGLHDFGIRGVAPVIYAGTLVGTVEIGHSFGAALLEDLHLRWGVDFVLYEVDGAAAYRPVAKAGTAIEGPDIQQGLSQVDQPHPVVIIAPKGHPQRAILLGPVRDYAEEVVAWVQIGVDRSEIRQKLAHTRDLMAVVGLAAIAISFLLTYLVTLAFVRPIREIVREAGDIAAGRRDVQLETRPRDEIGILTQALNRMLDVLRKRRMEIEEYARSMERRVEERTADLVAAEEKYRTLVEHVPLIVYRILQDGTTEFVNSHLTESLGYTIEEAVGDKGFWPDRICGQDQQRVDDIFGACFSRGVEFRTERDVRHRDGRLLTFIDHAIPEKDADGKTKWVDGIMMDITELKKLQARAFRAEEIRILQDISSHMAHQIRNPLVTAGGFARRLSASFSDDDPRQNLAQIVVAEVARLEGILKVLLSSIKPFDLTLAAVDLNRLLEEWISKLNGRTKSKDITIDAELSPDLPEIQADRLKISYAFENILKHAIVSMPTGERLTVSTRGLADRIVVTFKHKALTLSADDLDSFFFPHYDQGTEWQALDLPLSKIIIHRHGGKVELAREADGTLLMRIEFPTYPAADIVDTPPDSSQS
jgi:PAS domain S-box-containing protein